MQTETATQTIDDLTRLAALNALEILDTGPEQSFDDIVQLATRLCSTPVALVSLVSSDRQWFKARVGFPACETDLDRSVCRFALSEPDLLIVPDLREDPRTAANPLVTGEPHIRFYAGAPLRLSDGMVVGSLCVIDTEPRPEGLSREQADDLRALGRQVAALMDMRRAVNARNDAESALRKGEERFRTILNTVEAAFAIVEVKFDDHDRPVDYRFVEANPAFEHHAGVNLRGKWVTEFAPDLERFWFDTYGHVAKTGEPATFENYAEAFKRWFDVRAVRVGQPEDRQIAILFSDMTARKKAEDDLRASEALARTNVERVQLALAAGAIIGTWHWDLPTDRFTVDEAFAHSFGLDPTLGREGIPLAQIVATVHPDDQAGLAAAINEAVAKGGAYAHQYRVRRADGHYYWIEANGRVDKSENGTPLSFPGVLLDVEERRKADLCRDGLLELSGQLRDAIDLPSVLRAATSTVGRIVRAGRVGYGTLSPDGTTFSVEEDWTAPGLTALAGTYEMGDFGHYVHNLRSGTDVIINDVRDDPRTSGHCRNLEAVSVRTLVNLPIVEDGKTVAVFYVNGDAPRVWTELELDFIRQVAELTRQTAERRRAEEQQKILNQELSHRLKNTLAMVLSIATQTLRLVPDKAPVEAFEKRIHALSSAHEILLQQSWAAAPLKAVARAVLNNLADPGRVKVTGPEVPLTPRATLSVALLLHELATNALKYGALSNDVGQVDVSWRLDNEQEPTKLVLDWHERGGPPVMQPPQRGFGSRLIRMGLVGTGDVDLSYPPDGFRARVRAPLAQIWQS